MKKVLILVTALLIGGGVFAQGIKFEHGTFAEALAKAKKENKLVFMDCYTSWCGPCKALAKNVFPQKEVGDYFNQHFVSIKIDMEKGEGVELKEKYQVKAFPTLLFMDSNGSVVHKMTGGVPAEQLIEEAKVATDPNSQLPALGKRYEAGERSAEFINKYTVALFKGDKKEEAATVGNAFLKDVPNYKLKEKEYFYILGVTGLKCGTERFKYVEDHKKEISEAVGESYYKKVVLGSVRSYLKEVGENGTLPQLEKEIKKYTKDMDDFNRNFLTESTISNWYLDRKMYDEWFDYNIKFAHEVKDPRYKFSKRVMTVYTVAIRDEFNSLLSKAIKEAHAIAKDSNGTNADKKRAGAGYYNLILLYKKSGDIKNAKKYVVKLKEVGEDMLKDPRVEELVKEVENM